LKEIIEGSKKQLTDDYFIMVST